MAAEKDSAAKQACCLWHSRPILKQVCCAPGGAFHAVMTCACMHLRCMLLHVDGGACEQHCEVKSWSRSLLPPGSRTIGATATAVEATQIYRDLRSADGGGLWRLPLSRQLVWPISMDGRLDACGQPHLLIQAYEVPPSAVGRSSRPQRLAHAHAVRAVPAGSTAVLLSIVTTSHVPVLLHSRACLRLNVNSQCLPLSKITNSDSFHSAELPNTGA